MASTNKTTHYELSQYTGSDKPTYLVDYNTDMSNIDTGIYNAQSKANTNETAIGTLSNLNTSDKSSLVNAINEIEERTDKIGNLSNLTTSANTDLVVAINEVDAEADLNNQNIGTMVNLETTIKTSLVGAINEVNTNNNSNTSAINLINQKLEDLGHSILWQNPNPTTSFNPQTIQFDQSIEYDMYEVIFATTTSNTSYITTGIIPKGKDCRGIYIDVGTDGAFQARGRASYDTTATSMSFTNGCRTGSGTDNSVMIPEYVIGYQTGLYS